MIYIAVYDMILYHIIYPLPFRMHACLLLGATFKPLVYVVNSGFIVTAKVQCMSETMLCSMYHQRFCFGRWSTFHCCQWHAMG